MLIRILKWHQHLYISNIYLTNECMKNEIGLESSFSRQDMDGFFFLPHPRKLFFVPYPFIKLSVQLKLMPPFPQLVSQLAQAVLHIWNCMPLSEWLTRLKAIVRKGFEQVLLCQLTQHTWWFQTWNKKPQTHPSFHSWSTVITKFRG